MFEAEQQGHGTAAAKQMTPRMLNLKESYPKEPTLATPEQLHEEADLAEKQAQAQRRLDDATSAISRKFKQNVTPTADDIQARKSAQAEVDALKLEAERIHKEISAGGR